MSAAITGFIMGAIFGLLFGALWSYNFLANRTTELLVDTKRIYREQANISTQFDRSA